MAASLGESLAVVIPEGLGQGTDKIAGLGSLRNDCEVTLVGLTEGAALQYSHVSWIFVSGISGNLL